MAGWRYKMSYTDESIKLAVEALRENYLNEYQTKLKPTHAHEIVSACFGYKSKIALKSDDFFKLDPDEPETFEFHNCTENIENRIKNLKGLNVSDSYSKRAEEIISFSIKPECSICGRNCDLITAAETNSRNTGQLWSCSSCASKGEDVGYCRYCGENEVYPIEMLNNNGECPEHAGESFLSEEEEEDWNSYIEYQTKDF